MRLLVIEDEYKLAEVIESRLKKEKYLVDICTDGLDGLDNALSNSYDLIILDIMLPNMNGFDILKEIRNKGINSKVIMMTAKDQINDKLTCFNIGANDYITKPFHIEELIARVNVQLRNENNISIANYIEFGDLKLYNDTPKLFCSTSNDEIEIVGKEY